MRKQIDGYTLVESTYTYKLKHVYGMLMLEIRLQIFQCQHRYLGNNVINSYVFLYFQINSKYDDEFASNVMCWVNERVTAAGEPSFSTSGDRNNVFEVLGDGYILCK